MRNKKQLLPGWTLKEDEFSPGIFKITMTDSDGRKAEITDVWTEENMNKCASYAFDIEKQVNKNWNKFLFDTIMLRLGDKKPSLADYNDKAFGSWIIEMKNKRIILDGKDGLIIHQSKADSDWKDQWEKNYKLLTFDELVSQIKQLESNGTGAQSSRRPHRVFHR